MKKPEVGFVYWDLFDTAISLSPVLQSDLAASGRSIEDYRRHMMPLARRSDMGELTFGQYQAHYNLFLGRTPEHPDWDIIPRLSRIEATHRFAERLQVPSGLLTNIGYGAIALCTEHDLLPVVDAPFVVESHDVGLAKPDAEIYEHAAALVYAKLNISPANILFIDDNPDNIDAARAAGWQAEQFNPANPLTTLACIQERYGIAA